MFPLSANMPIVLFPAAPPLPPAALDAVATALTSPEYVYLLRVVTPPRANMPTVLFPVADPQVGPAVLAEVAEPLVQLE